MKPKVLFLSFFMVLSIVFQTVAQNDLPYTYTVEIFDKNTAELWVTWGSASEKLSIIIVNSKEMPKTTFKEFVFLEKGKKQLIFSGLVPGEHYLIQIRSKEHVSSLGGMHGVRIPVK